MLRGVKTPLAPPPLPSAEPRLALLVHPLQHLVLPAKQLDQLHALCAASTRLDVLGTRIELA
jgi:hypothetical protein